MQKPQPSAPIIFTHRTHNAWYITVHTPEAERWIKENAGEFGVLQAQDGKQWSLLLYAGYAADEVIAYLSVMPPSSPFLFEVGDTVLLDNKPAVVVYRRIDEETNEPEYQVVGDDHWYHEALLEETDEL